MRRMTILALIVPALVLAAAGYPAQADRTAAELVGSENWDDYFPFRLGDSWTYDWKTEGRLASGGPSVRTRVFDGTSFLNDSVAYKLVSDDGTFHLYTFDDGVLAVHSSVEMGRYFDYESPVVIAAPDLRLGQTLINEQSVARRRWETTLLGVQVVTVPIGTFPRTLAVRLEMTSSDYASTAVHYFAPRVGLVAYRYTLREADGGAVLLAVDAQLRLTRLDGVNVRSADELARIAPRRSASRSDRRVQEQVRAAVARRYTWGAEFRGFRGDAVLIESGRPTVTGSFVVTPDLTVQVDAPDGAARAALRNEISSFVTQRKRVDVDPAHVDRPFAMVADRPDGSILVIAADDPLTTTYTIRDGEIVETGRSMGRVSYVARERAKLDAGDGRTITTEYDVTYLANEDRATLSTEHTHDTYVRLDDSWVPTGRQVIRVEPGKRETTRELALTNLRRP